MFGILSFLVFILLHGAQAQPCVPNPVENVTLDSNNILHWQPSTNCDAARYIIYISIYGNVHTISSTGNTFLMVDSLPACVTFTFEVRAVSNNVQSDPVNIVGDIPEPSDTDLVISYIDASDQNGATLLQWDVDAKIDFCILSFRVTIHDGAGFPRDIYTAATSLVLDDLVPCGNYNLTVTAISHLQSQGPIRLINYEAPEANTSAPSLGSISATDTSITLIWTLPSYSINRCSIRSLDVEGLPYFHYIFLIDDSPERPLVNTTIPDLEPDSFYVLQISIINSAGRSPPFTVAVQTRP